jgi:hypothetical protein
MGSAYHSTYLFHELVGLYLVGGLKQIDEIHSFLVFFFIFFERH